VLHCSSLWPNGSAGGATWLKSDAKIVPKDSGSKKKLSVMPAIKNRDGSLAAGLVLLRQKHALYSPLPLQRGRSYALMAQ
jgi:hypothetical protein